MDTGKLHVLKNRLQRQIHTVNPTLLSDYPLERYVSLVKRYPKFAVYSYVSREVRQFSEDVLMNSNGYVLELYHKCLLLNLIDRAAGELDFLKVPAGIKGLYLQNFERIIDEIENSENPPGFYMLPGDRFLKELGICNMKLIPAGAQKIDLCRLPLRFLFNGGGKQFLNGLKYVLFDLKGSYPLYRMQTDPHDPFLLAQHTPQGWRDSYLRTAEMLKMNLGVKGVFGSTWTPCTGAGEVGIRSFSVRDLVGGNGERFFFLGPSKAGFERDCAALTRPAPYGKSIHAPHGYLGIWARGPLIRWAERQAAEPVPG